MRKLFEFIRSVYVVVLFVVLEALSWIHLPHTLLRIAVSSAVSVGFIWIIARIFTAKLPLRV